MDLWIKRDDCTGLAGGGNKTRKLEFLLGEALEAGADTLITQGAVQSNHVRQTAACTGGLERQGAEVVVAGCTEVPLVLSADALAVPLVDGSAELARACVEACRPT